MAIFRGVGGAVGSTTSAVISEATEAAQTATEKATEAATSASNAFASETNAATSASNALSSANSAANSAAIYDDFLDRYLGAKTTEPTTDNDGNPLQVGALYYSENDEELLVWSGSVWVSPLVSPAIRDSFAGDGSTVAFTLSRDPSTEANTQVYINGIYQNKSTYSVSGTTLTFSTAPEDGDSIEVMSQKSTSVLMADTDNATYTASGAGAVTRTLNEKLGDTVSVKDFGAVGDGVTDDTQAIQAALDSGVKTVYAPEGTYKLIGTLLAPRGVSLKGDGVGATVFDASSMDYLTAGAQGANAVIKTAEGSFDALPDLLNDVKINDKEITFVSAHGLSVGDIVHIYNPTDGSWLGNRPVYRAGEYLKVSAVNGNTVRFEGSAVDDYLVAAVDLYKVNMASVNFSGFTLHCNPSAQGTSFRGLEVHTCKHSSIRDVEVITAPYIGISAVMCFDITIDNCTASDNFEDEWGGEYGLTISNCSYVSVTNGYYVSQRHGITTGGGTGVGTTTCRFMTFTNNRVTTEGTVQGFDLHGNAEYVNIANNVFDSGAVLGGDYITLSDNTIYGHIVNGAAVIISEVKGCHYVITGNLIKSNMEDNSRGQFIDCGGNSSSLDSNVTRGGIFNISNNSFVYEKVANDDQEYAGVVIRNTAYSGVNDISISFVGNTCEVVDEHEDVDNLVLQTILSIENDGGNPFDQVTIANNTGRGGVRGSGAADFLVRTLSVTGNNLSYGYQCTFFGVRESALIANNTFKNIKLDIGALGDSAGQLAKLIKISDNYIYDSMWGMTGSSSTRTSIRAWYAETVYISNNVTDDNDNQYVRYTSGASVFTAGETVTGNTSGATYTHYDSYGDFSLVKKSISGTLQIGETVTGSTSGATAALSTTTNASTAVRDYSVLTADSLYTIGNVTVQARSSYKSGVTTETAL